MVCSGRILVVGIDASARGFCAEALSLSGYAVEIVHCAAEALVRLNVSAFDAVVSDVDMPETDGIDLYRRALTEHPYLSGRFIFTGPFFPVDTETEKLASFKWLAVPLKSVELFDAVREVAGIKKTPGLSSVPVRTPSPSVAADDAGKRRAARIRCTADCFIADDEIFGGRVFAAKTKDISVGGAFILHDGAPLVPYMPVCISMDRGGTPFKRDGRVAWARFLGIGVSGAGLRFSEPVGREALKALL